MNIQFYYKKHFDGSIHIVKEANNEIEDYIFIDTDLMFECEFTCNKYGREAFLVGVFPNYDYLEHEDDIEAVKQYIDENIETIDDYFYKNKRYDN